MNLWLITNFIRLIVIPKKATDDIIPKYEPILLNFLSTLPSGKRYISLK